MSSLTTRILDAITDGITGPGYAVVPDFLAWEQVRALAGEAMALQSQGHMRRAMTGTTGSITSAQNPRGDFIYWLDETAASDTQHIYLQAMAQLRQHLNASLFLGLFELESHFAVYPPGAIYRKHLDQFRGKEERQISCILYLNSEWHAENGGQLRLYLNGTADEPFLDIPPVGGTLVTFLSGQFLHEVLPAKQTRISLTGWFRTRTT